MKKILLFFAIFIVKIASAQSFAPELSADKFRYGFWLTSVKDPKNKKDTAVWCLMERGAAVQTLKLSCQTFGKEKNICFFESYREEWNKDSFPPKYKSWPIWLVLIWNEDLQIWQVGHESVCRPRGVITASVPGADSDYTEDIHFEGCPIISIDISYKK
jgi:hypothetical protein